MYMLTQHLLPWLSSFRLDAITTTVHRIDLALTTTQREARCPMCGQPSHAVHSRYRRTVADFAWAHVPVRLSIHTRRFFCRNATCDRTIFTERLPVLVQPSARRSQRLAAEQRQLALDLGGEVGARTATRQGMPVSSRTLLRLVKRAPRVIHPTPRILGVDDFAFRKGHTYGTLLVDLERRQPVDMLPDRSAESLIAWLEAHPGVEIITRDRGLEYTEGATRGAPHARQVADRFHLLQNLREMAQRILERHQRVLQQVARLTPEPSTPLLLTPLPSPDQATLALPEAIPEAMPEARTSSERERQRRRSLRQDRYHTIHTLKTQGCGIRAIARQLHLSRPTVRRMLGATSFPERGTRRPRPSKLDAYQAHLCEQLQLRNDNALALWRDLRDQHGYTGSRALVSRWVARHRYLCPPSASESASRRGRPPATVAPRPPAKRIISARQAAWLLLQPPADPATDDSRLVSQLCCACADIQVAYPLVQEFRRIVRERHPDAFDGWLQRASGSGVAELRSFSAGLRRDHDAVYAALTMPFSNAQVEGQINRLKCIKRNGYGRAKFELLRQRVLAP